MKTRLVGLLGVVVFLFPAGSSAGASSPEVIIQFAAFSPSQLDVLVGETATWTNGSQRTHTVTSDAGLFASGDLPGGSHFSFQFSDVGPYRYHCSIHPTMVGEVVRFPPCTWPLIAKVDTVVSPLRSPFAVATYEAV